MRGAAGATYFRAAESRALAGVFDDVVVRNHPPEARPAGAGVVLGLRVVERGVAADAAIEPGALLAVELARERPLGARLPRYHVRRRRQLAAPFGVGLDHRFDGQDAFALAGGRKVLDLDRARGRAPGCRRGAHRGAVAAGDAHACCEGIQQEGSAGAKWGCLVHHTVDMFRGYFISTLMAPISSARCNNRAFSAVLSSQIKGDATL